MNIPWYLGGYKWENALPLVILRSYVAASGQVVNFEKSFITSSVSEELRGNIDVRLELKINGGLKDKYRVFPFLIESPSV